MRILFDTNVVLDLLLDRKPHTKAAALLFSRVEKGDLDGLLCATTLTTVHYLTTRVVETEKTVSDLGKLLGLFEVAPVNRSVLEAALAADFDDFEDAVLYESARHADGEGIVTRNVADFRKAKMPIYSPRELVAALEASG